MKVYQNFKYKGVRVVVTESSSLKGNQFKTIVNGISLGCIASEDLAISEAKDFVNKIINASNK